MVGLGVPCRLLDCEHVGREEKFLLTFDLQSLVCVKILVGIYFSFLLYNRVHNRQEPIEN